MKIILFVLLGILAAVLVLTVLVVAGVIKPNQQEPTQAVTETEPTTETEEETTEYVETDPCVLGTHFPVTVPGIQPTCYEPGLSDKIVCEVCGFTLQGSEELPATNHANRDVIEVSPFNTQGIDYQAQFHCPDCDLTFFDSLTPKDLHMPIVDITGSFDGLNQWTKIYASMHYYGEDISFDCDTTLRIQGQSSTLFPKLNYAIQFLESGTSGQKKLKVELFEGHKESKYVLKANYVDASAARNVVAARIYKQIAETRDNGDPISQTDCKGVIDGFPVLVYHDGSFEGLYTLNMPRDNWVYEQKRGEEYRHAALFSRRFVPSNYLRDHINWDNYDWKLEFDSTEEVPGIGTEWIADSFNSTIDKIRFYSDAQFREQISEVVNVDRAIDCLIYTIFIAAYDNRCKNNLYLTYDGVQWALTMYDMDASFGLSFDGSHYFPPTFPVTNFTNGGTQLYFRLYKLYFPEICARYKELRKEVLTYGNVDRQFREFFDMIPTVCYDADFKRTPSIPQKRVDQYTQIMTFVAQRLEYLDGVFGYTP